MKTQKDYNRKHYEKLKREKLIKKEELVNELLETNNWVLIDNGKKLLSKDGEVFSLRLMRTVKGMFGNGYYYVNENGKAEYIHRLVAQHFIPNPNNYEYVDHINTIATDNRVENLRWVDAKGNMNNPLTRRHCSESHKGKPAKNKKAVEQYNTNGELVGTYASVTEAADKNNMRRADISTVLIGKQKTAKGFIWRYANVA